MSYPKSWNNTVDVESLVKTILSEIQVTVDVQADPGLGGSFGEEAADGGMEFSLQLSPTAIEKLKSDADEQTGKRLGRLSGKVTDAEREAGSLSALGSASLEEKFKELGLRFGQKFADKAIILVQNAIKSGDLKPSQLFNPGQVKLETKILIPGKLRDLARLKPSYGVRGKEKGKGEMLASIMFGFDNNVDEPDITIPGLGGWHIKSFGDETKSRNVVQSGEGEDVTAGINTFLDKWGEFGVKKGINMRKTFINKVEAKILESEGETAAKEFRNDWNALAAISTSSPKGSKGMIRLNQDQEFFFIPFNKVQTNGIAKNGRLEIHGDFLKNPTPAANINAMKSGDSSTAYKIEDRITFADAPPDADESMDTVTTPSRLPTYATRQDLDDSIKRVDINRLVEKVENILIKEELTRADKKDIDKMIAKRIEADRVQQKKDFQKNLQKELKSSKFQKMILEMAKSEMGKELKGKQLEGAVLEITKKVIKKLYRELSFSYNPVIDRIKL